jgi:hypothetical protein
MEKRVTKSAIQLLTLSICAAALVAVPTIAVKAAASNSREIEKNRKKTQNSPGINNHPKASSPAWPPPMYDDPDRNPGGGGGM